MQTASQVTMVGRLCLISCLWLSSCQQTQRPSLNPQATGSSPVRQASKHPIIKDPKSERWDVVTAKFRKVLRGEKAHYRAHMLQVLDPDWQDTDLPWPADTKLALREGRYYTFSILTTGFYEVGSGQWLNFSWITKVVHDGMTLFDESLCHVHGRKMIRKSLPVSYGDVGDGYAGIPFAVWRAEFPNGTEHVFGGCSIDQYSPRTRRDWVCPACVRAADDWRAKHGVKEVGL